MMDKKSRIKGDRIDIEYDAVKAFFEARGLGQYASVLSATMYQDAEPELVRQRDEAEKAVIAPKLALRPGAKILDIACGVGRWGWFLGGRIPDLNYVGIDFSTSLIARAQAEAKRRSLSRLGYQIMSAIDIKPEELLVAPAFDLVLISGLLIYLNDDDCQKVLADAGKLCAAGGRIYVREPVGLSTRLSLDRVYSNELENDYSAIYRTVDELGAMICKALPISQFRSCEADFLFPAALEKRSETRQYYAIMEKV